MTDAKTAQLNVRVPQDLADWCDSWGIKSVQPDLRTYGGYQWPHPGQTAACDPDRLVPENTDACPRQSGDGLCVATSWRGMMQLNQDKEA